MTDRIKTLELKKEALKILTTSEAKLVSGGDPTPTGTECGPTALPECGTTTTETYGTCSTIGTDCDTMACGGDWRQTL